MKNSSKFHTLKTLTLALAAFAAMTTSTTSRAQVPDVKNPEIVEAFVDGVVKPLMKQNHSPSGVVAVMKDGEIIFSKGYGYIDVEKRIPVDPEISMFRPGSISKLFTWISVMQLVEQGKLDLDADVNQYLKTLQIEDTWPGQPVTMRHILTHTPGFEDGGLGYLIIDDPDRIIPLNESLAKTQPDRVNPPGTHTAYSNWGTALAGLIVANVTGIDFNSYVQENIFDVLGMTHSSFVEPLPPELDAHMAKAYRREAGKYVEINYEIISNFGPAGAAAVSAPDMANFARALLADGAYNGGRILQPETLQQMIDEGFSHDPRVNGMGLGFIKRNFGAEGLDIYGHDGGTTVFISHFGLSKQEDFMLFSSFSGPGAAPTHSGFVQGFYDEFFPREVPHIEPPADFGDRAAKYAGTYNNWRSNFNGVDALLMRGVSDTKVTPMPDNTLLIGETRYVEIGENLFRAVEDYTQIAFQENGSGRVTGFVIDGLGVNQTYRASFYETGAFIFIMLGVCILVFAGIFLRLAYQWPAFKATVGVERKAWLASLGVAGANILFFVVLVITISGGIQPLMYEIPTIFKVGLVLPLLAMVAAFYHGYLSVEVWRGGLFKSVWSRLRFSVVSILGLFLVWFYYYWNLLGFQYTS